MTRLRSRLHALAGPAMGTIAAVAFAHASGCHSHSAPERADSRAGAPVHALSSQPNPSAAASTLHDVVIRHGIVYDGSGAPGRLGDIAVDGDRIVALGDLPSARARLEIDARGLSVAPGFVNCLSWAGGALTDSRNSSDLRQGVTLEVMGEGWSAGPTTSPNGFATLGGFFDSLTARHITLNLASFVGATTLRLEVLGNANRAPTPAELRRMQDLVRHAMTDGALGVASALIYAPATYAKPDELTALARAAAESGGAYMSHLRSEGDRLLESVDELIAIARATGARAGIYHLKAAGEHNWPKMIEAIQHIEQARAQGLSISANMYPYAAMGTSLGACVDPALQQSSDWVARLREPSLRRRVAAEIFKPGRGWENVCQLAGSPDRIVLLSFNKPALERFAGKTLRDAATARNESPEEAAVDLLLEDTDRPHASNPEILHAAFFVMSDANVKLGLSQPWVSFGSDESVFAEGVSATGTRLHPRAFGTFARFLGHYVRDDPVTTLSDAIRRLATLPAETFKLDHRGRLAPGYYADIVIFDPANVRDPATFQDPDQFATGVRDVLVNGVPVLRNGKETNAKPGRIVRGPGVIR